MGISTIQSYQGSKIFEAIGISKDVIGKYFTDTKYCVGSLTLEDIQEQTDRLHSAAFDPLGLSVDLTLESRGQHKARGNKEEHLYNPETIHLLQQSAWTGNYELFKQYSKAVDEKEHCMNLRGMLDFNYPGKISVLISLLEQKV